MNKNQKKKYKKIQKLITRSKANDELISVPEFFEAFDLINELTEEIANYRGTLQVIARGYLDEEGCSKTASSILEDYPHE